MITLKDIILALSGIKTAAEDQMITEAVIDSRRAIPGSLFVALVGENTNGHQYVGSAFQGRARVSPWSKKIFRLTSGCWTCAM